MTDVARDVSASLASAGPLPALAAHEIGCRDGADDRRPSAATTPARENDVTKATNKERAVLVTTSHRGVFFGYASDTSGAIIALRAARNCLFWPADQKGFLGLASEGPKSGARIGPSANIELRDITCVADCTEAAAKAWENAPWSR